jgi:hypothetical protein
MRGSLPPRPLYFQSMVLNSEEQRNDLYPQKEQNYINGELTVENNTALFEVFARLSF